jgi:hypothetical protein
MYAINRIKSENYTSSFQDPRLISSAHSGQSLLLDAPVLDGSVKMSNVYDNRITKYDNLSDIELGNVYYYYDMNLMKPYYTPLFSKEVAVKYNYVDPMGTVKPHYDMIADTNYNYKLSFLKDTQNHRQDLLSKNMWNRNQTEPLYKSQDSW